MFNGALEVRGEFCARLQRAGIMGDVIQTFHVWLPSVRRCRGEYPYAIGYLLFAAAAAKYHYPASTRLTVWLLSLRRGEMLFLISQKIFFVKLNAVLFEHFFQLLLKTLNSVMRLLTKNVLFDFLKLRWTDRKRRIASLPAKDFSFQDVVDPG